jgi:hypothetical protein
MYHVNRLVYGLFATIGIALLLSSFVLNDLVDSSVPANVATSLGVVTLSTTLLNLLWRYSGGEPLEKHLLDIKSLASSSIRTSQIGLVEVYPEATEVSTAQWLTLIRSSRTSIDISSHTMSQFLDQPHLWQALVEALNRGVKIRLLLNSQDNPALAASGSSPLGYLESRRQLMQNAWETFEAASASLPPAVQANLIVGRLTNESMFVSVRRFDDTMYVAQYLYTDKMRNNPVLVVRGTSSPLFMKYLSEFEGQLGRTQSAPQPGSSSSTGAQR